jgi:WD40 repeat protein
MKLLTADENGLLKVISLESKNYESYGVQSREECVRGMAMFSSESVQNEYQVISVLRSNGNVETWQYSFSESRLLLENTLPTDLVDPTGIKECPDIGLIAYSRSGEVSVIKDVSKAGKSREMKVKSTFSIPGPVTASATCRGGGMAFGGKENDLMLYDIGAETQVWKAKNVANDHLSLRVPIWIADISFRLPEECSVSGATMLTGTGYKHVRGYDTRLDSHKPTFTFDVEGNYRITSIASRRDGNGVYVGDASGGLFLFDIRTQRRQNTLKGPVGSIRELTMASDGGCLATVGLDRYARVYSTKTNKAVSHVYVKNRTNFVQFLDNSEEGSERCQAKSAASGAKRKAVELDEIGDELALIGSDLDDSEDEDTESSS